jgi:nucleoside-diphosphate-sugar epimerase
VRTILVAIPPVTHSTRDRHGFIPTLIKIARDTGVSGYVGEGANHWPAGHVLDIGRLYRLALDKAPAGVQLYGAAEQGITVCEIAETIGRRLDLPAVSIPAEQAADHFAHAELNEATELLAGRSACGAGHPHNRTPGNARSCISCTAPAHVSASSDPPGWFVHLSLPTSLLHMA